MLDYLIGLLIATQFGVSYHTHSGYRVNNVLTHDLLALYSVLRALIRRLISTRGLTRYNTLLHHLVVYIISEQVGNHLHYVNSSDVTGSSQFSYKGKSQRFSHLVVERLLELLGEILSSCVNALLEVSVLVGECVISICEEYLADLITKEPHLCIIRVTSCTHVREQVLHVSILYTLGRVLYNNINGFALCPVLIEHVCHVLEHLIGGEPILTVLEVQILRITCCLYKSL